MRSSRVQSSPSHVRPAIHASIDRSSFNAGVRATSIKSTQTTTLSRSASAFSSSSTRVASYSQPSLRQSSLSSIQRQVTRTNPQRAQVRFNTTSTEQSSLASDSNRPFRILGVQQIAIGALDKAVLSKFWVETLGLKKIGHFRSEKENVDEDIVSINSGPLAVEIDLMEPIDANKSPKVHVPALNHVGFWVDDIHKCVEHLTAQGVRFTPGGIRKGAAGHEVCFIHPKGNDEFPIGTGGVLVELVQAPQDVIDVFTKYGSGIKM